MITTSPYPPSRIGAGYVTGGRSDSWGSRFAKTLQLVDPAEGPGRKPGSSALSLDRSAQRKPPGEEGFDFRPRPEGAGTSRDAMLGGKRVAEGW